MRNLGVLSVVVLIAMGALLYVAFRNHRHALIVLVNLPLALVGGVFAVALTAGVLSVASLVGFITLFGIATRNGVLLVSHYQHLIAEERGVRDPRGAGGRVDGGRTAGLPPCPPARGPLRSAETPELAAPVRAGGPVSA